jgi:DNA (cytosine-5)-methyltransferase 1
MGCRVRVGIRATTIRFIRANRENGISTGTGCFQAAQNLGKVVGCVYEGYRIGGGVPMAKSDEFVTIKQAAQFLGVAANSLRNWDRDAKIPVYRNPISRYRLFKKADLEKLLRQIKKSGKYPTGWSRPTKPR